ncbi:unnamed protein product [marine sediment metagenome]|uniref:DUF1508 domain-containing protein n=1 Tax=marine sediment metagenome TaxID=412755 RepID=X0UYZ2_9ZZZZ
MKGYHVVFEKYLKDMHISGWRWSIFFNKKRMAESSKGYNSEKSAKRAFWRITSKKVQHEIIDNYYGGKLEDV